MFAAVAGMLIALLLGPAPSRVGLAPAQGLACITMNTDRLPLDSRASPLDSVSFTVQGASVKICYSRPAARGRTMLGDRLPYGTLWRTGANEPTMIHTSTALSIAGVHVAPGTYSLYTVPGADEWEIIINRSISQWGHERFYTEDVREQEVGRGKARSGRIGDHAESLTFKAESTEDQNAIVFLEWEHTQVAISVKKR